MVVFNGEENRGAQGNVICIGRFKPSEGEKTKPALASLWAAFPDHVHRPSCEHTAKSRLWRHYRRSFVKTMSPIQASASTGSIGFFRSRKGIVRPAAAMIELFYFFYFQSTAINMAYMPAHLRALGLSGRQISTALAVAPVLSLGVPLGWAWLADRTRRHDRVLRIVAGGAWLGFSPLVFLRGAAARSFSLILAGYL